MLSRLALPLFVLLINVQWSTESSNQIQRSILNKRINHTNPYSLRDHYKNCDNVIKNKKFASIASPFFPAEFPLPIYCRWVIDLASLNSRSENQIVVVHLNEIYLKRGLKFTEYSYYLDENLNIDKRELAIIDFESDYTVIWTKRKYLVIQFQIDEKINSNLNARILNSAFQDNGFNVTFELTNRSSINEQDQSTINVGDSKEFCSFKKCNFNGRCIARSNQNSLKFKCECFDQFHGENCEFGPDCDPFKQQSDHIINPCMNGGNCVYSNGPIRVRCRCPDDYVGSKCEKPQFNTQLNVTDNRAYTVKIKLSEMTYEQKRNIDETRSKFGLMIVSMLKQNDPNFYVQDVRLNTKNIIEMRILYHDQSEQLIKNIFMTNLLSKGLFGRFLIDKNYFDLSTEPVFSIVKMSVVHENETIDTSISCLIKDTVVSQTTVKWLFDGEPIDLNSRFKTFKHKTIMKENNSIESFLIIQRSNDLDGSTFTCSVSNSNYVQTRSIYLQLNQKPNPILNPPSMTANYGQTVSIDCYSNTIDHDSSEFDSKIGYHWRDENGFLNQSNGDQMIIQDLFPTGSRLIIFNVTNLAEYKCCAYNLLGSTCADIFVDVIKPYRTDINSKNYLYEDLCQHEIGDSLNWKMTYYDFYYTQKCPDGYIGQVRRKCMYLGEHETPKWSEIDYSNCRNMEFDRIFQKFKNYFLGYSNRSYDELIEILFDRIKAHKFKNGENEVILQFIEDNLHKLIENKRNFKKIEYQGIIVKFLNILDYFLAPVHSIYNLEAKNRFQYLLFELGNQIDLYSNDNFQANKSVKVLNFKNFEMTFIDNELIQSTSRTLNLPLNRTTQQNAIINLSNSPDSKSIFLVFKVNHFLLAKDLSPFNPSHEHKTNYPEALNYFSIKKFLRSDSNDNGQLDIRLPFLESNENIINCAGFEYSNDQFKLTTYSRDCHLVYRDQFNNQAELTIIYSPIQFRYFNYLKENSILKGNSKIAINAITLISCTLILVAMILNLLNSRRNSSLSGVMIDTYRCLTLIINHLSAAMVMSTDQKSENYLLMLFSLSQISALTIQFCIFVAIEHNFDGFKSQFNKNISLRITIVSTVVPFSLIGLIYEYYYTSMDDNLLWTLKVGSTLFFLMISGSLLITLANLSFYIKLNTRLQPFKRKDNSILNLNLYENTSKILTQTLVITILLNIHLTFIILIFNMPANLHEILVAGYAICSLMITLIVLFSFRSGISKLKPSKRSSENLSLNKSSKKTFRHHYHNSEIQSIFN